MILGAFAALYLLWGSTYLTIAIAIETLPPFLMAGARFLCAGLILFAYLRWRGEKMPAAIHWKMSVLTGGLMILGGNGGVTWAEQYVASSVTALIIATTPLWAALLPWMVRKGPAPTMPLMISIVLGLSGVALLVWHPNAGENEQTRAVGVAVILLATLSWAIGSLWSRAVPQPGNPLMSSALQMICGGGLQLVVAGLLGELWRLDLAHVSARSAGAWVYLIFFGSIGGFGAFAFLLRWCPPSRVFTYAFVNPLVAVVLGWWILNEPVGAKTLGAAGLIVSAVALTVLTRKK
jgi:drug/metabolite transporter (DMT)-like permease